MSARRFNFEFEDGIGPDLTALEKRIDALEALEVMHPTYHDELYACAMAIEDDIINLRKSSPVPLDEQTELIRIHRRVLEGVHDRHFS